MKNSKCTQYNVKLYKVMLHTILFPLHRLCKNYLEYENFFYGIKKTPRMSQTLCPKVNVVATNQIDRDTKTKLSYCTDWESIDYHTCNVKMA